MNSYVNDNQIKFTYGSTGITVTKEDIKPKLVSVGATKTIREDGSIISTVEAWSEIITFNWPTIVLSEFNYLLGMLTSNSSEIKVYLEPTTDSGTYATYNIIYDSLNMGVEVYTASGTVRQNVSITVGKAYA